MSFGLKISFGRLINQTKIPAYEVIHHYDYFNVINKDGSQSNEFETEECIFGKNDEGFYLINKKALVKGIQV